MADNIIEIKDITEESKSDNIQDMEEGEKKDEETPPVVVNEEQKNIFTGDLETKLKAKEEEAKNNYDKYLRTVAEFDNYKKRASREFDDYRKFSNEALIREILTVLDNMERAIEASSKDITPQNNCLLEGVNMTCKELLKIFKKFGVEQIESCGKIFDPAFHQALFNEETDEYNENTVVKELQKGYIMHGRLLRPAMVVIAVPKQKS
ncbi:MAG: nucleotide exchange factor GrpE [Desulfobacterales bacterium]|nr:nucleotide exchange factor GrpE [Desulfobacterales bacterium]MBF0397277.1 nucleotide exchange factor GrpE [Desulfobacterales bacterium]